MAVTIGTIPNAVRLEDGVFKVGDTRVSLDTVVYHFNNGSDAAEIQRDYDAMSLAQVHAAIAFYLHNKDKVDKYLAEREIYRAKIRKELEANYSRSGMREMLLARQKSKLDSENGPVSN